MVFFSILVFLSLFSSSSVFYFPLLLLVFWFHYMIDFASYVNQSFLYAGYMDEVALFMVYMTVFVLFISYVYSLSFKSIVKMNMVFSFMLLFCYGVFTTNSLFLMYFFYESSLLPILYIIIKWGSYPERSLSAMMLLIYTSIFTFPFIMVMFYYYSLTGSFNFNPYSFTNMGLLSSLVIFLTFAVKLPIYGLHFWLPMAHVEAPTFGSMILAGILLKLGGVGLMRFSHLMDLASMKYYFLSYFMVFMIYVTVVCLFQSDFKRLVAYSSVSHMMAVPILFLANNLMSSKSLIMIMLFHGLSSPILFMLVGVIYAMYSSRQLIMIRGLVLVSPLVSLLMILAFLFTLSAPPFPSFVAEVYFLVSSLSLSYYFILVFCLFTFLSLIYNLNWLVSMVFSTSTPSNMSTSLTYLSFMPLLMSVFLAFVLMGLTILL